MKNLAFLFVFSPSILFSQSKNLNLGLSYAFNLGLEANIIYKNFGIDFGASLNSPNNFYDNITYQKAKVEWQDPEIAEIEESYYVRINGVYSNNSKIHPFIGAGLIFNTYYAEFKDPSGILGDKYTVKHPKDDKTLFMLTAGTYILTNSKWSFRIFGGFPEQYGIGFVYRFESPE